MVLTSELKTSQAKQLCLLCLCKNDGNAESYNQINRQIFFSVCKNSYSLISEIPQASKTLVSAYLHTWQGIILGTHKYFEVMMVNPYDLRKETFNNKLFGVPFIE